MVGGPVEKHNPLKKSILQSELLRDGKTQIEEISFDMVKRIALKYGLATDVLYQMSAGKEASIFLALWKNHPIILKVYRIWHSSHSLSKSKGYVAPGTAKRSYVITDMIESLAVLEYDLLSTLFKAGAHVPTPIGRIGNFVSMRFIGDGEVPAPQLREITLEEPERVMNQIFDDYLIMYRDVHHVHGDLSQYNILFWQDRPWIIDVPQAEKVDKHCNMLKIEKMLLRDIENVLSYFEQYDISRDPESILEVFLESYIPDNKRHYRELVPEGLELV